MRTRSRTIVLMPEDQSPLFQIIGGHFDSDAIPGQGFDPILFHPTGGVGDELMPVVELNAITGVRQDLGHETLELQELFLCHVMFPLNDRPNAARVEHGRRAPAGRCDV